MKFILSKKRHLSRIEADEADFVQKAPTEPIGADDVDFVQKPTYKAH